MQRETSLTSRGKSGTTRAYERKVQSFITALRNVEMSYVGQYEEITFLKAQLQVKRGLKYVQK